MKHNMGTLDRVLRAVVGIILGYLIFTGKVQGVLAVVLGIFGITLILTSAFGYCPPYSMLGISTCKCEEHSKGGWTTWSVWVQTRTVNIWYIEDRLRGHPWSGLFLDQGVGIRGKGKGNSNAYFTMPYNLYPIPINPMNSTPE